MPDLSTVPTTRAPRTNAPPQGAAGASSPDAASSDFLDRLEQSCGELDVAGAASPPPGTIGPAEAQAAQPQLVGQPATPADPPLPNGKAVISTQTGPTEKKALGQARPSPADDAEDTDGTTPPQAPPPPALIENAAKEPQPSAGTPPRPGHVIDTATSAPATTTADNQPAKRKSDPVAPEPASASAEGEAPPDPAAQAPAKTGEPPPPLRSAELRRTKLTTADPEDSKPAAPAEPAPPLAPATTAAPPLPATPHPAILTLLQPATALPPQPPPSATPAPPAVQLAQAVAEPVRVALAAPPQQGGPHVTTIQLDPVELGRVEIRIERTNDGPARIDLSVQRHDTLLRLVHDQTQLQQALDQAGIPQQGRTITFSLATDNGTAGSAFTNLAGDGAANGNGQRSHQGYGNPRAGAVDTIDPIVPAPAWNRIGLDITA